MVPPFSSRPLTWLPLALALASAAERAAAAAAAGWRPWQPGRAPDWHPGPASLMQGGGSLQQGGPHALQQPPGAWQRTAPAPWQPATRLVVRTTSLFDQHLDGAICVGRAARGGWLKCLFLLFKTRPIPQMCTPSAQTAVAHPPWHHPAPWHPTHHGTTSHDICSAAGRAAARHGHERDPDSAEAVLPSSKAGRSGGSLQPAGAQAEAEAQAQAGAPRCWGWRLGRAL